MRVRWGLGVAAAATALVTMFGSPASAGTVFCGASRGLTAQSAIDGAIDDARNSAQSMGFYGACTLVGEPQIFETFNDPNFGHIFRAQVNVTCGQ